MNFRDFRAIIGLPLAALVLAAPAHLGAVTKTDRAVQALANFPALQRLGQGKSSAVRGYLDRVADAYREVGYHPLASAIEDSAPLIQFFAEAKSGRAPSPKQARAALRRLKAAAAKTRRIVLPQRVGEKIPNYYGLALAFLKNSRQALKNASSDRAVNFGLHASSGMSWLQNIGGGYVSLGGTLLSGGTLRVGDFNLGVAGSSAINVSESLGRNIELSEGRWIAFPRDLEIPAGTDLSTLLLLSWNYHGNDIELSAGTRLVKVSANYAAPVGTVEITGPATLSWAGFIAVGDDFELLSVSGTELIRNGWACPSPTPAQE